jgi:hypothetical protein
VQLYLCLPLNLTSTTLIGSGFSYSFVNTAASG